MGGTRSIAILAGAAERRCPSDPCVPNAGVHTDGGFVLVPVLWLLALLTLVTMVLLTTVRVDMRAAGQFTRHAEASWPRA
jgi:hypothetical protein